MKLEKGKIFGERYYVNARLMRLIFKVERRPMVVDLVLPTC